MSWGLDTPLPAPEHEMISLRRIASAAITSIVIGLASPTGATVVDDLEAAEAATPWVNDHGTEKRRLELPGGITVEQEKHGDTINSVANDPSPGGAVRCLLLIYASALMEETLCPGSSPEWHAELVRAVDRLNEFASEHALTRDPPQTLSRAFRSEEHTSELRSH